MLRSNITDIIEIICLIYRFANENTLYCFHKIRLIVYAYYPDVAAPMFPAKSQQTSFKTSRMVIIFMFTQGQRVTICLKNSAATQDLGFILSSGKI